MNVASLELCKELYELSGWDGTDFLYSHAQWVQDGSVMHRYRLIKYRATRRKDPMNVSAYDLGYLLSRLPRTHSGVGFCLWASGAIEWSAEYDGHERFEALAKTPEDAACKLAIELFKLGVLARGGDDE